MLKEILVLCTLLCLAVSVSAANLNTKDIQSKTTTREIKILNDLIAAKNNSGKREEDDDTLREDDDETLREDDDDTLREDDDETLREDDDETLREEDEDTLREDDEEMTTLREDDEEMTTPLREDDDETLREDDDDTLREDDGDALREDDDELNVREEEEENLGDDNGKGNTPSKDKKPSKGTGGKGKSKKPVRSKGPKTSRGKFRPKNYFFRHLNGIARTVTVTTYRRGSQTNTTTLNKLTLPTNIDTVIIFDGYRPKYVEYTQSYFNRTVDGFLSIKHPLEIVAVNISGVYKPEKDVRAIDSNVKVALAVGNLVGWRLRKMKNVSISLVGDDIGNAAVVGAAGMAKRPVDYIYGLNQRIFPLSSLNALYLREDMGNLVQTINTMKFPYMYGHRNFYMNNGLYNGVLGNQAYIQFSRDIKAKGTAYNGTICPSYDRYITKFCTKFSTLPLYNTVPANAKPKGIYYGSYIPVVGTQTKRCA